MFRVQNKDLSLFKAPVGGIEIVRVVATPCGVYEVLRSGEEALNLGLVPVGCPETIDFMRSVLDHPARQLGWSDAWWYGFRLHEASFSVAPVVPP
jgi:hypothetical protein